MFKLPLNFQPESPTSFLCKHHIHFQYHLESKSMSQLLKKKKKSHVIFTEMTVYPLGPFLKHSSPILLHSLAAEDGPTDLVLSTEILGPKVRYLEPI